MKIHFMVFFLAALITTPVSANQGSTLIVEDFRQPSFSLSNLKNMNNSCINKMITWWENSSCKITGRYGNGSAANMFDCIDWDETRDRPTSIFTAYSTKTWTNFPFRMPGDEIFCKDDDQIVLMLDVWSNKG